MKQHQRPIGNTDEWITPPEIIGPLMPFDLDPCAPAVRPWDTAEIHYSEEDNGLSKEWKGRVWLNPPFNRKERPAWMQRMAEHGNGIMLIPAACETKAFYDHVWGKADAILFLKGRPHFHFVNGARAPFNSGTSIVLIAYGAENVKSLEQSGLGQVLKIPKPQPY